MQPIYLFSIIMAAYNAADYITEAIDSLKQQTLGFENLQLILVDDGSTDNTFALAQSLTEGCPNVQILSGKHVGVSAARNLGLTCATGCYVNFMDADDKLSPDTLQKVYDFFRLHEQETDICTIPMMYFGHPEGEHPLNIQRKETGVVDLCKHPEYIVTSASASFIRAEAAKKMHFDERLEYGEGARALLPLLLARPTLGIIGDTTYWYRMHGRNRISQEPNIVHPASWYQPFLDHYCMAIVQLCLQEKGSVPAFIQYTLAFDLQIRLLPKKLPDSIMDEAAKEHYRQTLWKLYQHIDDQIIMDQKIYFADHKLFILKNKYRTLPEYTPDNKNVQLCYNGNKVYNLNRTLVTIDFIQINGTSCIIEGGVTAFPTVMEPIQPYLLVNGKQYTCTATNHMDERHCLDELVMKRACFCCRFELPADARTIKIQAGYRYRDVDISPRKYRFGTYIPLDTTFSSAYGVIGNYILQYKKATILLEKASRKTIEAKEAAFISEVRASGKFTEEDLRLRQKARARRFGRPIWLISDRYSQADDNGEAFFEYMCKHHRHTIRSYFVLSEDSKDIDRLKKTGPVLIHGTTEHKLLYLQSQCTVSSQANDINVHPLKDKNALYKDLTAQKPFIFLQHGVIKDDLSSWLNRYNMNLRGFITTAKPEFDSICTPSYGYSDREVWLTGLARHDRLYNASEKLITMMPTWRRNLMDTDADGQWIPLPDVDQSSFVTFYRELFQNPRLNETANRLGYTLAFKPHPNVMTFISSFHLPETVRILDQDTTYRETFAISDLVLTDYSSAVFDFAYLRKPIVYYQGDREEFFAGHTYVEGYFDYERDGFGEVTYSLEDTVELLISYMETGCKLKDKYRERMDTFFPFHDKNCCKRTYEKIRTMK